MVLSLFGLSCTEVVYGDPSQGVILSSQTTCLKGVEGSVPLTVKLHCPH